MPRRSNGMLLGGTNGIPNGIASSWSAPSLHALEQGNDKILARLDTVDQRLEHLEKRPIDRRLREIVARLDRSDQAMEAVDRNLNAHLKNVDSKLNARFESVDSKLNAHIEAVDRNFSDILKAIRNSNKAAPHASAPAPVISVPAAPQHSSANHVTAAAGRTAASVPHEEEPYLTSLKDVLSSGKSNISPPAPSNTVRDIRSAILLQNQPQPRSESQSKSQSSLIPSQDQPLPDPVPENANPNTNVDAAVPDQEEMEDDLEEWIEEEDGDGANIDNNNSNNIDAKNHLTTDIVSPIQEDNDNAASIQEKPAESGVFEMSFGRNADDEELQLADDTDTAAGSGTEIPMSSPPSTPACGTSLNLAEPASDVPMVPAENMPAQNTANIVKPPVAQNNVKLEPVQSPSRLHNIEADLPAGPPPSNNQISSAPPANVGNIETQASPDANSNKDAGSNSNVQPAQEGMEPPPNNNSDNSNGNGNDNVEVIVIDSDDDYNCNINNSDTVGAPSGDQPRQAKEEQQDERPKPIAEPSAPTPTTSQVVPPVPGPTINNAVQTPFHIFEANDLMDVPMPRVEPYSSNGRTAKKRRRSESPEMDPLPTSQTPSALSEDDNDDNDNFGMNDEANSDILFDGNTVQDEEEVLDGGEISSQFVVSNSPKRDPDYSPRTPRRSTRSPGRSPGRTPGKGRKSITPTRPAKLARTTPITLSKEEANLLVQKADEQRSKFNTEYAVCPHAVLDLYKRAAVKGDHPLAMLRVGELLLEGASSLYEHMEKIVRNHKEAGKWIRKCMQHREVVAACSAADEYYDVKGRCYSFYGDYVWLSKAKNKSKESLQLFQKGAEIDPSYGQYKVGWWYYKSFWTARSDVKKKEHIVTCIHELLKAYQCESGDASAILGSIYENVSEQEILYEAIDIVEGRQVPKAEREVHAKSYFMMSYKWDCAAGTNDAGACFEVGYADIQENFELAVEMYTRSFTMGYFEAATNLGLLYEIGNDKEKFQSRIDMSKAIEWYMKGDRLGDPRATHHLAVIYMAGKGVQKDYMTSIKYYEKALRVAGEEGTRSFNDVLDTASEELVKLAAAIILMDDPLTKTAEKIMERHALKSDKTIEKLRIQAEWIMASELKPSTYSHLKSAREAPGKLQGELGEDLGQDVALYVCSLAADYKKALAQHNNSNDNDEISEDEKIRNFEQLEDARQRIMQIVVDHGMQESLELVPPRSDSP